MSVTLYNIDAPDMRYSWNIVESGDEHYNLNLCLRYQIRNESGEFRNNTSLHIA
jgi:hypothetical protein